MAGIAKRCNPQHRAAPDNPAESMLLQRPVMRCPEAALAPARHALKTRRVE
ncbi:hypothetical protein BN135_2046 [Cronobacter muytjensii 530]